jgi:hypothetical protein
MEDKQQQQQQQQQDDVAVQPRRSSRLVESPLTNETRINTNKNKSPFINRRLLPTQHNRSSPVARKRSASVFSFADSVLIMPPKKKTKTVTAATTKTRTNWTKQEDLFLCIAFVNVSKDPVVGTGQKAKEFWSRVHKQDVQRACEEPFQ